MVLINNLTIDEINAALLHLQRARTEVVGGTKGSTVQNITISNKGGGSTVDYAPTITALSNRVDKNTDAIESVEDEIDKIQTTLEQLSDNGISSMTFDPVTRQLQINTQDGEVYSCDITSENIILNFDATTNKLTLEMGEQYQEVTLPYINANEKGSANGVATLDGNGRVPYSQLPAQVQSDWTQTDSTEPDFIKNKIPIWITSGGADDNMSPVDVVEQGNTRPVTSGGVYGLTSTGTDSSKTNANLCYAESTRVAFFRLAAGSSNCPPSNNTNPTYIEAFTYNDGTYIRVTQMAYDNFNRNASYIRSGYGTVNDITWTSWVKVTTTADIVDSVTDGSMQPVTSNAVYDFLMGYGSGIGTWFTSNTGIKNDIDSSFNNASNYTLFYSHTQTGAECGWYGFKHTAIKGGICLIMTRNYGVYVGYGSGVPSTWTYKKIMRGLDE